MIAEGEEVTLEFCVSCLSGCTSWNQLRWRLLPVDVSNKQRVRFYSHIGISVISRYNTCVALEAL